MKTNKPLPAKRGNGSLVRPLFWGGQLLEDEDLSAAITYTQDSMRLMMRSLFGCGVVCGLQLAGELTCERRKAVIRVDKGVALDCLGNPIELPKQVELEYDPGCEPMPKKFWVSVCHVEESCMSTRVACGDEDDQRTVHRRSIDRFEVRLHTEAPSCVCGCEKPGEKPKSTRTDACCDDHAPVEERDADGVGAETATTAKLEGPCACYTDHNEGVCGCECSSSCVLLGTLSVDDDHSKTALKPDHDGRRFVRPMLLGAMACYCKKCLALSGTAPPPIPPVPDPKYEDKAAMLHRLKMEQIARAEKVEAIRSQIKRHETQLMALRLQLDQATDALQNAPAEKRAAAEAVVFAATERLNRHDLLMQQITADRDALDRDIVAHQRRIHRGMLDEAIGRLQAELADIDEKIIAQPQLADVIRARRGELTEELRIAMNQVAAFP